jgi:hypothetical protein
MLYNKKSFSVFSASSKAHVLNGVTQSSHLMIRPVRWNNFIGRKDTRVLHQHYRTGGGTVTASCGGMNTDLRDSRIRVLNLNF